MGYLTSKVSLALRLITSAMGVPLERCTIPKITYANIIEYFVVSRPPLPNVGKGALLRQNQFGSVLLTQVFLDSDNNLVCRQNGVPYGRQIFVKELDQELLDAFAHNDLIIVE